MGVQGLLGLLKSIQKPCKLDTFRGQTIGVDAYGWLHRGAVAGAVELATGKATKKHINFALQRVRMLIHFGVTPYIVFDGDRLPSKGKTELARAARRAASKAKGLELLRQGKDAAAYQELQKCIDITPKMARELIEELKKLGVRYVVAPYEADAQLVFMEHKGLIDGILSEDSDMLVFGARVLLTKLDSHGDCVMIRRADFTACKDINLAGMQDTDFRCMAILSGCDYLESLPKMGLKTAHKATRKFKTIERILRGIQLENKIRVPAEYLEKFIQADNTFKYQYVFCPQSRRLVHLTEPQRPAEFEGVGYIGSSIDDHIACGVADGHLDPMTKEPIEVLRPQLYAHLDRENRTPLNSSKDLGKHKSIDTFFKPKRTPLAELDPNSFTPSPLQQQALERNRYRESWSSEAAYTTPARDTISHSATSITRRNSSSSSPARGSKRMRLCVDEKGSCSPSNEALATSKYFSNNSQHPPASTLRKRNGKSSVPLTFNLWSDDSIECALADLPEPAVPHVSKAKMANQDRMDSCVAPDLTAPLPAELHTSLTRGMDQLSALTNESSSSTLAVQSRIALESKSELKKAPSSRQMMSLKRDSPRSPTQSIVTLSATAPEAAEAAESYSTNQPVILGGSEDLLVAESDVSGTEEIDDSERGGGVGLVESSPVRPQEAGSVGLGFGLDLSKFLFQA